MSTAFLMGQSGGGGVKINGQKTNIALLGPAVAKGDFLTEHSLETGALTRQGGTNPGMRYHPLTNDKDRFIACSSYSASNGYYSMSISVGSGATTGKLLLGTAINHTMHVSYVPIDPMVCLIDDTKFLLAYNRRSPYGMALEMYTIPSGIGQPVKLGTETLLNITSSPGRVQFIKLETNKIMLVHEALSSTRCTTRIISISGSTFSIGTETHIPANGGTAWRIYNTPHGLVMFNVTNSTSNSFQCVRLTISGTTITTSSQTANLPIIPYSSYPGNRISRVLDLGNGRYMMWVDYAYTYDPAFREQRFVVDVGASNFTISGGVNASLQDLGSTQVNTEPDKTLCLYNNGTYRWLTYDGTNLVVGSGVEFAKQSLLPVGSGWYLSLSCHNYAFLTDDLVFMPFEGAEYPNGGGSGYQTWFTGIVSIFDNTVRKAVPGENFAGVSNSNTPVLQTCEMITLT